MKIFLEICTLCTPLLMLIFGWILLKKPPKDINGVYGYRTLRSMKTQETWDYAQRYCGKIWLKVGTVLLILSIIGSIPFFIENQMETGSIILPMVQVVVLIITIYPVEKALQKNFDEQGKPY